MCCWFFITATGNTFITLIGKTRDSAATDPIAVLMLNGGSMRYCTDAALSSAGPSVSTGTWYFGALVLSSTNAYALYRIDVDGTVTSSSGTSTHSATTVGALYMFRDDYTNEYLNGAIGPWYIFEAALTQDQVLAQSRRMLPIATPWAWGAAFHATDGLDLSGNGRDFTVGGTLTASTAPPVGWGQTALLVPEQAAASGDATANAGVASAASTAYAATATGGASVTAAVAAVTTTGRAATATGGAAVTTGVAASLSTAYAATSTGGASVTAGVAAVTTTAYPATASSSGDATATAGVATLTTTARAATATGGATVTAGLAQALTTAYAATASTAAAVFGRLVYPVGSGAGIARAQGATGPTATPRGKR